MNHAAAAPGVSCVLLNAQGLTGRKLAHLLPWCRECHTDLVILTETHTTTEPAVLLRSIPGASTLWPGARFLSIPGSGHTLGVTVILGPTCHIRDPVLQPLPVGGGRVLRLDLNILGHDVSVLGIYAPAHRAERTTFFRDTLPACIPMGRMLILGGDFNCVTSALDCVYPPGAAGPAHNSRLDGSIHLQQLMTTHDLVDVWREQHAGEQAFTHWSRPARSGARLDRWLVSANLLHITEPTCHVLPAAGIHSDHLPVTMHLTVATHEVLRGKGVRAFPLLLLNMPAAFDELTTLVEALAQELLAAPANEAVGRWDNMKEQLRRASVDIYRRHQNLRVQVARQADANAAAAWGRVCHAHMGDDFVHVLAEAHRLAALATDAWQTLSSRTHKAAEVMHHLFADTSSYYFYAPARTPQPPVLIRRLNRPGRADGEEPHPADLHTQAGLGTALTYAADFYRSTSPFGLFREQPGISTTLSRSYSAPSAPVCLPMPLTLQRGWMVMGFLARRTSSWRSNWHAGVQRQAMTACRTSSTGLSSRPSSPCS